MIICFCFIQVYDFINRKLCACVCAQDTFRQSFHANDLKIKGIVLGNNTYAYLLWLVKTPGKENQATHVVIVFFTASRAHGMYDREYHVIANDWIMMQSNARPAFFSCNVEQNNTGKMYK